MRVNDPGHFYELDVLDNLDSEAAHLLVFVKRIGKKYPGNEPPANSGTTLQEVLRACIDRAQYVNRQTPCAETEAAIGLLKAALLLFEVRAKRVKRKTLTAALLDSVIGGPTCKSCGHVMCQEHGAPPHTATPG